jgi:undecaprenyl-diphosphatase
MVYRRAWKRLRTLERGEIVTLLAGVAISLLLWGSLALASEVMDGNTKALDAKILLSLRKADDLSRPVGPPWMEHVLLDITALGSSTVLGLFVLAVAGFMLLQQRFRTAFFVILIALSAEGANRLIKSLFSRPRPDLVPHLRQVDSLSFPSGHAMESAIIYLTLGAMLMRMTDGRLAKIYCMSLAVLVTLLVGISRVFLGVHYPTDVIGGWMFGFLFASFCWLLARRFEAPTGVAKEREARHR